ncbi:MAG: hypothetical protein ACI9FJ_003214 [Alteromonadaceae bacterium]
MPLILAGPILRKTTVTEVVVWLVLSEPLTFVPLVSVEPDLSVLLDCRCEHQVVKVSDVVYVYLLRYLPEQPLPKDTLIYYDVKLTGEGVEPQSITQLLPELLYKEQQGLSFFIPSQVSTLFFGSCRNPHHPSKDTLVVGDHYLAENLNDLTKRPCVLVHGGDQVYVDDIAGPTLKAIHQLIKILNLSSEELPGEHLTHSDFLHQDPSTYYNRKAILPKVTFKGGRLFGRLAPLRKTLPVFSSVKSENHAISLAEVLGLYLLVWSPECWLLIEPGLDALPPGLSRANQLKYQRELLCIKAFIDGLSQVRRLLAHIPNYMIFDDHDVTDDWNLTAQWEQNVYSNPLSKRIISNAMLGYWLFQGWGNTPERFDEGFVTLVEQAVAHTDQSKVIELETRLLEFPYWHYEVDLNPTMVVLDTRTHRWRSEKSLRNPSGLMDWERLVHLENALVNKEAGIVVSAAPIFGVKLIETIQRIFTFFGKELVVDAENWMAHPGSAKKLLDIFRRIDTPSEIVVLSGDVHYSFCFTAKQRFKEDSTLIWQLTCSGFKNEFPLRMINTFDKLERMLYFAASPINLFTKRRRLEIEHKALIQTKKQILIAKSSIGLVAFEGQKLKHFKILIEEGEFKQFV